MLQSLRLPHPLESRSGLVQLRTASQSDLDALIELLSDDPVSAARGDHAAPADRPSYLAALEAITRDAANALLVVDRDSVVVGTMQLTLIPGLARRGATRLQVEAVRVAASERSHGIGSGMLRWVTDVAAPAVGARVVQLTSDAARTDAHRFYDRLGFVSSHLGFKYFVG